MEPRKPLTQELDSRAVPEESDQTLTPDSLADVEDLQDAEEPDSTESPDDPYQNSDEALPDDAEERSIARDPARDGGRFGDG